MSHDTRSKVDPSHKSFDHWASGFGGMEWWNGTVEWNSGMVEYWNGGKTTPTNCAVSRPFPILFICHGPETSIP